MSYTPNEVMQYVSEEDVKFIRLAFCDVFGKQKNISIMPDELKRAFEYGIAIDASSVAGFGGEVHSDLLLHPEPSTIAVLPWRPEHGRVVRMFCDISLPDGRDFEADGRKILENAVKDARAKGIEFFFGSEMEFYLFKRDEQGEPTKEPYDKAGYMDIAPDDKGENVRREICLTLEQMGIKPESSHHEEGPGQNEIDFRYSSPITAADHAVTFRAVVNTIAARNGLFADFSPKPIADKAGNGMHINISARESSGKDVLPFVIAGVMNHIRDITVFLNPCEQSFERLGKNKAPKYVSWCTENRSQLIRIPAAEKEYRRAELRSPDPMCNPYLAFTLIIYAGLEGIEQKTELIEAADFNLYSAKEEEVKDLLLLPKSLDEAKKVAASSDFVKAHLSKELIESYCG
jgi:glutamine synthetase